jgi:hypothetical protein
MKPQPCDACVQQWRAYLQLVRRSSRLEAQAHLAALRLDYARQRAELAELNRLGVRLQYRREVILAHLAQGHPPAPRRKRTGK